MDTQVFQRNYQKKRTGDRRQLALLNLEDQLNTQQSALSSHGEVQRGLSTGSVSGSVERMMSTGKFYRSEVEDDVVGDRGMRFRSVPQMPHQVEKMRRTAPNRIGALSIGETESLVGGPLAWVESDGFQFTSALVIFCNAIVIGLETDMGDLKIWFYIEQSLLIFFVFELLMKLCRNGIMYFRHEEDWVWNWLDFGIVMSGVVDQWVMPIISFVKQEAGKSSHKGGTVFMLMRMLRLLRIVRLFRLVKVIRPLFQLAQGVLEAMQGMFWVLVFMIMTLYATAILCTRFIGHGAALPQEAIDDEEMQPIMKMFSTVPESMFTLFGTMTSWSLLKFEPLFDPFPMLQPLFVLFYIYSAWALLAVMTGVVSENLIAIRDQMVKDDEAKEEKRKQNITNTLFDLFATADADGSGSVCRAEFNAMLKDPSLMKMLMKNSNLRLQDLIDLFDWLDHDGGGTITIDEFMIGFKWVNDPLSAKSIVKLQERLVSDVNSMRDGTMEQIVQRFDQVMGICSHPIKKVHAISEQMDNLDDMCTNLKLGLKDDRQKLPTMRELSTVELNMHNKLDQAFDKVNRLYQAVHQQ